MSMNVLVSYSLDIHAAMIRIIIFHETQDLCQSSGNNAVTTAGKIYLIEEAVSLCGKGMEK